MSLNLACGWTFLIGKKEYFLDEFYPDHEPIFRHIEWCEKRAFSGIELGSKSLGHFTHTFDDRFVREVSESLTSHSVQPAQFSSTFVLRYVVNSSRKGASETLNLIFDRIARMSCKVVAIGASEVPGTSPTYNSAFPEGPPSRIQVSEGFSWVSAWEKYLSALSLCVDLAEDYGLKLALEPRPREMMSSTDSLLNLFRDIHSSNLGALVDTANLFVQREYIPLSLHKLGDKIFAVHLTDSDGLIEHHWAPGQGKIDWQEVIKAFSSVGYAGLFTIESFPALRNPEREFLQGKSFLERLMLTVR
jgi:sugar phosphate isomerase/epimerase